MIFRITTCTRHTRQQFGMIAPSAQYALMVELEDLATRKIKPGEGIAVSVMPDED